MLGHVCIGIALGASDQTYYIYLHPHTIISPPTPGPAPPPLPNSPFSPPPLPTRRPRTQGRARWQQRRRRSPVAEEVKKHSTRRCACSLWNTARRTCGGCQDGLGAGGGWASAGTLHQCTTSIAFRKPTGSRAAPPTNIYILFPLGPPPSVSEGPTISPPVKVLLIGAGIGLQA